MKIKHVLMGIAATTMAAAPALAAPAPVRASAPSDHKDNLSGGTGIIIAILAVAAIGGGIAAAVSGHSHPDSP